MSTDYPKIYVFFFSIKSFILFQITSFSELFKKFKRVLLAFNSIDTDNMEQYLIDDFWRLSGNVKNIIPVKVNKGHIQFQNVYF